MLEVKFEIISGSSTQFRFRFSSVPLRFGRLLIPIGFKIIDIKA
jgi:hypothetical protein